MDQLTTDNVRDTTLSPKKKPYTAPSFKFEPVFEISALACGKVQSTQSGCAHSRKAS
jgi:hypothetical protein